MKQTYPAPMPMPKLVILDCDGVLYPRSHFPGSCFYLFAYERLYAYASPQKNSKIAKIVRFGLRKILKSPLARKAYLMVSTFLSKYNQYSKIKNEAFLLKRLLHLHKQTPVCFFTDSPPEHLETIIKHRFQTTLAKLPFEKFNIQNTCVHLSFLPKTTIEGFLEICSKMGVEAKDAMMLDDNPKVLSTARQAGIQTRLITPQRHLSRRIAHLIRSHRRTRGDFS